MTSDIAIPAFSIGSIFLLLVVVIVLAAVVAFYLGLGGRLEKDRGESPGDSPFDTAEDQARGSRPMHSEVSDETKATDENPSERPRQPLMGRDDD